MKSVDAWFLVLVLLVLDSGLAAQAPQAQPKKAETNVHVFSAGQPFKEDPKDDELRKLLKARYNEVLAEVESNSQRFQSARIDYEWLANAKKRLLQAGLDLCDTPADKVALLTKMVEQFKADEKLAQARLDAARGPAAAIHRARYQRLDAEIHLLRARRESDKATGSAERRRNSNNTD